jgi:SopA-like catalytic domain
MHINKIPFSTTALMETLTGSHGLNNAKSEVSLIIRRKHLENPAIRCLLIILSFGIFEIGYRIYKHMYDKKMQREFLKIYTEINRELLVANIVGNKFFNVIICNKYILNFTDTTTGVSVCVKDMNGELISDIVRSSDLCFKKMEENIQLDVDNHRNDYEGTELVNIIDNKFDVESAYIRSIIDWHHSDFNDLEKTNLRNDLLSAMFLRKDVLISNSNIRDLPDNLFFQSNMIISNCPNLERISKNLSIVGSLSIKSCDSLVVIADDIILALDLEIKSCKLLKNLSKNNIYIDVANLTLIECPSLVIEDNDGLSVLNLPTNIGPIIRLTIFDTPIDLLPDWVTAKSLNDRKFGLVVKGCLPFKPDLFEDININCDFDEKYTLDETVKRAGDNRIIFNDKSALKKTRILLEYINSISNDRNWNLTHNTLINQVLYQASILINTNVDGAQSIVNLYNDIVKKYNDNYVMKVTISKGQELLGYEPDDGVLDDYMIMTSKFGFDRLVLIHKNCYAYQICDGAKTEAHCDFNTGLLFYKLETEELLPFENEDDLKPYPLLWKALKKEKKNNICFNMIRKLNLSNQYIHYFDQARSVKNYDIKLVDAESQDYLVDKFSVFYKENAGTYQLQEPHLQLLLDLLAQEDPLINNIKEQAAFLYAMATMYVKYSSSAIFGEECESPAALRCYASALLNKAMEIDSEITTKEAFIDYQNRLLGRNGAFHCTGILFGLMNKKMLNRSDHGDYNIPITDESSVAIDKYLKILIPGIWA